MASSEQRLDDEQRLLILRDAGSRNVRPRLKIAAAQELHLTVDDRSLCGLVTVDKLDVYQDETGLGEWNDGPLEQCTQCAAALIATTRGPTQTDTPELQTGGKQVVHRHGSNREPLYVNEDVNGLRVEVWEIGPPRPADHPEHYDAIAVDIETVDRYGGVVARTTLRLSPYKAKKLIERMHLALDATKHPKEARDVG